MNSLEKILNSRMENRYLAGIVLIKRKKQHITSPYHQFGHMFVLYLDNNIYQYRGYSINIDQFDEEGTEILINYLHRKEQKDIEAMGKYLINNIVPGIVVDDNKAKMLNPQSTNIEHKMWAKLPKKFLEEIEHEYQQKKDKENLELNYSFNPETMENKHQVTVNNCVSWAIRKTECMKPDVLPLVSEGRISLITKFFEGEHLENKDFWKNS